MRVLVACETSGVVRDAFLEAGHEAMSVDLKPTQRPGPHHQGDVLEVLMAGWDLMIAHPPCTYLANSGALRMFDGKRWSEERWEQAKRGAAFFRLMLDCPFIDRIAVENPVMHKYGRSLVGRQASQSIQPWMFGEDASKRTLLWLKNLPPLEPTQITRKARYANQTPSGQNKIGQHSKDRAGQRSQTYPGIAKAMAEQWGAGE